MATGSGPNKDSAGDDGPFRLVGQALGLGLELVFPALLGWWLDRQFGWTPAGVLIGAALGFVLVILHALRLTPSDKPPRDKPPQKRPPENPSS